MEPTEDKHIDFLFPSPKTLAYSKEQWTKYLNTMSNSQDILDVKLRCLEIAVTNHPVNLLEEAKKLFKWVHTETMSDFFPPKPSEQP